MQNESMNPEKPREGITNEPKKESPSLNKTQIIEDLKEKTDLKDNDELLRKHQEVEKRLQLQQQ